MTNTNAFDEAAARAWLQGADEDEPGYTIAESLGFDGDFTFESDGWPYALEDLANKAVDAGLLPHGTLVWLTCDSEGGLDGALVTRTYDKPSVKLCSPYLELRDLIDDRAATGIDCGVSVLSAIHSLASELKLPGTSSAVVDPVAFADTESLCATITVDAFRDGDETLTLREWAQRGWQAVRDLTAPVVALRNQAGVEIEVDLEAEEATP